jgi:hypothetical protein
MPRTTSIDDFLAALHRVVSGRYSGKPLFCWREGKSTLQATLAGDAALRDRAVWLDVNDLAEDVIPRRAGERFRTQLGGRLDEVIASGKQILVVTNPYLLLRYEPAAPLAPFWNRFVGSQRAVVVTLPQPVPRPANLPRYVQFRGDRVGEDIVESLDDATVVLAEGGVRP